MVSAADIPNATRLEHRIAADHRLAPSPTTFNSTPDPLSPFPLPSLDALHVPQCFNGRNRNTSLRNHHDRLTNPQYVRIDADLQVGVPGASVPVASSLRRPAPRLVAPLNVELDPIARRLRDLPCPRSGAHPVLPLSVGAGFACGITLQARFGRAGCVARTYHPKPALARSIR